MTISDVSALVPPVALFHESYECPLETQIYNVQEAGAKAAIIAVNFLAHANRSEGNDLTVEPSSALADQITMPSVLVTEVGGIFCISILKILQMLI